MDKNEKEILKNKEEYAKKKGYKLNPNKKIRDVVIDGLAKNKAGKGVEYCPCRPLEGNPQEDKKKICPCVWHEDEIKKEGFCHCRLFYKK